MTDKMFDKQSNYKEESKLYNKHINRISFVIC